MKAQVAKIVSYKTLPNGYVAQKIVADTDYFKNSPYNMMGLNISTCFGGFFEKKAWLKSKNRKIDPS